MYTDVYYRKLRTEEYKKSIINKIKRQFKGLNPCDVNIFFDMDNTLYIYSTESNDLASLKIQHNPGFFANLELCDKESPAVLAELIKMGYKVYILSACCSEAVKADKRAALAKHFPFLTDEQIIFTMNGENKAEKIQERGIDLKKSILVDDYCVNLFAWMEKGGLAIKKTFSNKKRNIPQIHIFEELFGILKDLA